MSIRHSKSHHLPKAEELLAAAVEQVGIFRYRGFTLTREGEHSVLSYRGPLKTVPAGMLVR